MAVGDQRLIMKGTERPKIDPAAALHYNQFSCLNCILRPCMYTMDMREEKLINCLRLGSIDSDVEAVAVADGQQGLKT